MKKEDIIIRKSRLEDVPFIRQIVNKFAEEGKMLPLSINQIYERIRDFSIIEKNGKVIGCGALKIIWRDLAEIRSVAIKKKYQKKGYGKKIVEELLKEAEQIKIKKVFVLTNNPAFFSKLGFEKISKQKLPHKIWIDCINCPKFPKCDEIPMMKILAK
ncbi:MAG: N-acetyltransferase [Candidatus Omnitrophica bacterium]|nr:N-acetyltransferase [Candidatus Omnitrophota bacterium]MCM8809419.1 N-acetyltransferase [Candidatus Omnitrophota bacterium]MCM8810284.1 N-acetyltransferase [Candidatus Omnitrophota bacterium]MCM8833584.1 N-acetyltransferase [Candidatus Omnitrophota bacterium]